MMKVLPVLIGATMLLGACTSLPDNSPKTPVVHAENKMMKQQTIKSKYSFEQTVERLTAAIQSKGMTVFATIDHQQAAKEAGLDMQPATVIVFGNPKAGTPLMIQEPTFALQLPLKVLVTQVDDEVLVSFNDTKAMIGQTNINYTQVENTLVGAEKLIIKTVSE